MTAGPEGAGQWASKVGWRLPRFLTIRQSRLYDAIDAVLRKADNSQ